METSHFDASSAYVAVSTGGPADGARLLRTRDFGATWVPIVDGLRDVRRAFVVREDPFRRGLLLAGTDRSIFLSFDDGETWRPWRLNLPQTPVRDLQIRDATVIAATGGRGFWAIDDISPLRQVTGDIARAAQYLFRPAPVWRMRAIENAGPAGDAPVPPPPPTGVPIWYLLGPEVRGPIAIEIIQTETGDVIRRFDATAAGPAASATAHDGARLDGTPGLHRVIWDLRYAPPLEAPGSEGPLVLPGTYQVRLTASGRPLRQAVIVRMDPRVRASNTDLAAQLKLARAIDGAIGRTASALAAANAGTPAGETRRRLSESLTALRDLAARVKQADVRPSPAFERRAAEAIGQSESLLASAR
jgi:hypothetical protein